MRYSKPGILFYNLTLLQTSLYICVTKLAVVFLGFHEAVCSLMLSDKPRDLHRTAGLIMRQKLRKGLFYLIITGLLKKVIYVEFLSTSIRLQVAEDIYIKYLNFLFFYIFFSIKKNQ